MGICICLVRFDVDCLGWCLRCAAVHPTGWASLLFYLGLMEPCAKQGVQKLPIGSSDCPPPRKSLVKGERFLRYEGRPERGNDTVPPKHTIAVTRH